MDFYTNVWCILWQRYHLNHHFKVQNDGFGITSPFWDYVFGTVPAPLKYDPAMMQ